MGAARERRRPAGTEQLGELGAADGVVTAGVFGPQAQMKPRAARPLGSAIRATQSSAASQARRARRKARRAAASLPMVEWQRARWVRLAARRGSSAANALAIAAAERHAA